MSEILRIWWPGTISNRELWQLSGQSDINMEIRKRKFVWIGHTLRKDDGTAIRGRASVESSRK
jgi:hypothetical protein